MYQPQGNDYMSQPHSVAPAHVIGGRKHVDWRLTGAYVIAAVGMGCAIACLLLLASFKNVYDGQMAQMHNTLSTAQTAQSKSANSISDLSGQLSSAESELSLLTPYNMTCSQYLTGPGGGPSTFYFPCRMKPGS